MELPQFKAAIAEQLTLLRAMERIIPERVDKELLIYLERVQDDPVGLEFLRNAIRPASR